MTNDELKVWMEKIDGKLDLTIVQTTKTNGRVTNLEDRGKEQDIRIGEQRSMLRFIGTSFFLFALTCIGFVFQRWLMKH